MHAVLVIAWRDLRTLLSSAMFYAIASCCTVLWSIVFIARFLEFGLSSQPGIETSRSIHTDVFAAHVSAIYLVFLVVIPALTMRLLAEEKKMRTMDLLLTAPITSTQIAVGKFLAGFGATMVLIGISFLYPLLAKTMADFTWGPLITTYLGLSFIGAIFVSIGLFASSLTESAVLSIVMGLVFNLIFWFISMTAARSDTGYFGAVMEYLSLGQHFGGFIGGAIKTNSTVFFLTGTAFFVFLTQRVIESARWRS
jgi:ABC-2 type transport system permease protein